MLATPGVASVTLDAMSNLDQRTLGWKRPQTLDGRKYPLHLRQFEAYDDLILPLVAELEPATFDDLSIRIRDAKARAWLPYWLTSAEWRGLIERRDPSSRRPQTYVLGSRAAMRLPHAA